MKVFVVGIGPGSEKDLTYRANEIIDSSDIIIGANRMISPYSDKKVFNAYMGEDIKSILEENKSSKTVSILVSGDVGFFSATRSILNSLDGYDVELIPGISSIVYFASKVGLNWSDLKFLTLHGRDFLPLGEIANNRGVFILTDRKNTPNRIASLLIERRFKDILVSVGENLSYPNERIVRGTLEEISSMEFSPLNVMIIENKNPRRIYPLGIDDGEFIRGKVPMTKSEVRTLSVSKLQIKEDDIIFDIGAGTGSVSIEMANMAYNGYVYAIEKKEDAISLLEENKEKFFSYNLNIINGCAENLIDSLEAPTKAFIGGSSGKMDYIVSSLLLKNKNIRIVVNAIALETLNTTLEVFKKYNLKNIEIVQVNIAKSRVVGGYNMMMGQNPVYILSGDGS